MEPKWNVLIADDEPIIREGIRDAVNWAALDMAVVAEAEDGEEALEKTFRFHARILLVDINMPIMDGLTFIQRVRHERPECKMIIITGHDEFHYAQEALRLGVDDYILKPTNGNQLTQLLRAIKQDLEQEDVQQRHLQTASRQIAKNFPLLRERFCLEWIEGRLEEEEILEQLAFLQLPTFAPCCLGAFRWLEVYENAEKDRQLFLFALENIISEYLSQKKHVLFREASGLILFSLWEEIDEGFLRGIEESVQRFLHIKTIGRYTRVNRFHLNEAYRNVKQAIYREEGISPLIRKGKQIIDRYYHMPDLTLAFIAERLHVSPVYLSRLFKQELGLSFIQILTQIRLQKAAHLLKISDWTIQEIAEHVGYNSQHYFSTAFKKANGVSPNQYRRHGTKA